ncbi:MAG: S9 family peptidase [Saprospiraceae bacterium]|nr:S9 family peptidase [Saprospiraceae bacterium]
MVFIAFACHSYGQEEMVNPSFEQVLSLKTVGSSTISHNGEHVLFTQRRTDWDKNRYDTEIWLSKDGKTPFQLTNTHDGSSNNPQWSPDDQWIAFTANRGDKNQIHVIRVDGGEAFAVTHEENGINGYRWTPDGKGFIITMSQKESKPDKTRKERYGAFEVDDNEYKLNWLYQVEFNPSDLLDSDLPCYEDKDSTYQTWDCIKMPKAEPLIDSVDYTIRGYDISPDGKWIAFTHTPDPLINSFMDADISLLNLEDLSTKMIINNPSADNVMGFSPDGNQILYSSSLENRTSNYYENNKLFIYDVASGNSTRLVPGFDENIRVRDWNSKGIFATASQRTQIHLFKIDPVSNTIELMADDPVQFGSVSFSEDGTSLAYSATHQDDIHEVYHLTPNFMGARKVTSVNDQIKNWKVAQSEVITWKSKDGQEIEGVLHKPMDYDPTLKYPLLVAIHGGPTGTDRPYPVLSYVYPVNQWLNKGALVLRVNYRGSAGYGEAFRKLNVENLGVGDAWDVMSGVDHLVNQGLVDEDRMGCMGWSQGGYISAFLTTNTDRFKAISVGAGISNWMTYYVNTDIHPFTRQYLKATPWENEEVYRKTSPMTNINNASTPTLIQHGEFDRRVPIANAYELLQGLRDNDVDAKLVVYKGFGHGITKPKERLAAVWHNWHWFNKYLWDEKVEMPMGK